MLRRPAGVQDADIGSAIEAEQQAHIDRLLAASSRPVAVIIERLRTLRRAPSTITRERQREINELEIQLEAAHIREALGVRQLFPEDIELWDNGHLLSKLQRFIDLSGFGTLPTNSGPQLFSEYSLRAARRTLYGELFAGYDISAPNWLTPQVANDILDRVLMKPALYAACGIVSMKYAAGYINKSGSVVPLKRPTCAVREIKTILERAGLGALGRQFRVSQLGPALVNNKGAKCDNKRVRHYTTQQLWLMRDLARVWRETQIARLEMNGEAPISLLQLKRSLKTVSQSLADASDRMRAENA